MNRQHWNYFLSIEQDVIHLARYVEFHPDNMDTFSIEIGRLLMTAAQEVDVLAKQLCQHHDDRSKKEGEYRVFIRLKYPKLPSLIVTIPRYGLQYNPYGNWAEDTTPDWWTANNKVKHDRHTHYAKASLGYMLRAVSGLLLMNLHYSHCVNQLDELYPRTQLFDAPELRSGLVKTVFGNMPKYRIS